MRNRTLSALLAAEVVSTTGSAMTFIALPWFVLVTSGSALRMSLVLAVEVVPMALFGIPSGSVVGRLGARLTMLCSDAVRAPLIALVPALYWSGHLVFGELLVIVFALGVFNAPYLTAQRSIVPELFGEDEVAVMKASALFGGANQLPIVIGPAIAGVLIGWLHTPAVLVIDAGTYVFAFAAVLFFVRGGRRVVHDEDSKGLLAGVRYLAHDRILGPMTLTVIVLDGAAAGIVTGVPLLAFTRYHQNPHLAGWIFSGFGVGAVLGSLAAMKLLDRFQPLKLAAASLCLATLPLWAIAAPIPWYATFFAVVACAFFLPLVQAPAMGLLTTRPPAALRAKVLTAVLTASGLGSPVGRILIGPIYHAWGNAGVWVAIALGMTIGAVLWSAATLSARDAPDVAAVPPVA
ncbi:MAG TPA: MFS transporter [Gaiellaceae bacterium]|nr:MFS transporter [Gaiellaceae bacterium]